MCMFQQSKEKEVFSRHNNTVGMILAAGVLTSLELISKNIYLYANKTDTNSGSSKKLLSSY